jgi:phosphoribosylformylglycinamidine synthase
MPRVLILRAPGTNCDHETAYAFLRAGGKPERVHINRLLENPSLAADFQILCVPGGFSFGDDIAAGRVMGVKMRERLWPALRAAAERGVCMIGACNGFQIMVQVGLLPGPPDGVWTDEAPAQTVGLAGNERGRFVDAWGRVEIPAETVCVWTRGLEEQFDAETLMLPCAHGEGRLVAPQGVLDGLEARGQVAVRYAPDDDPNGSARHIAGICDVSGRIFALMPHPERYLEWTGHPWWTRLSDDERRAETPGLTMFRNAVESVMEVGVEGDA